jgi:aconitate decarboxylase
VLDGNPDVNALTPQRLHITLADSREVSEFIPYVRGSPQLPMTEGDYKCKFSACLSLAQMPISESLSALLQHNPLAFATSGIIQ